MANGTQWKLSGDYFENCNCDVVCTCLVSRSPPLTAKPTQGECDVALAFHIGSGINQSISKFIFMQHNAWTVFGRTNKSCLGSFVGCAWRTPPCS